MKRYLSVQQACKLLLEEKVVAVPTETVYGLAALATSKIAIEKIYQVKNRPADNPLICHFHDFHQVVSYVESFPDYVNILQCYFSPGPISYLLRLKENSNLEYAVRNQPNIIIRIPSHPLLLEILECVNQPLAAPSANTSGRYSPTNAQMVADDIGDQIDGIVDGGKCETGIESTIIDCTREHEINILRPGSIGKQEIEYALVENGYKNVAVKYSQAVEPTPGNRYKHYAPKTKLHVADSIHELPKHESSFCVLASREKLDEIKSHFGRNPFVKFLDIGSEKNPQTIAQNLYARMAELDSMNLKEAFLIKPNVANADWARALSYRLEKMTERN